MDLGQWQTQDFKKWGRAAYIPYPQNCGHLLFSKHMSLNAGNGDRCVP